MSWLLTHLMVWLRAWSRGHARLQDLVRAMAFLGSLQAGHGALGSPRCGLGGHILCVLIFDSNLPQTTGELIMSYSCLKDPLSKFPISL